MANRLFLDKNCEKESSTISTFMFVTGLQLVGAHFEDGILHHGETDISKDEEPPVLVLHAENHPSRNSMHIPCPVVQRGVDGRSTRNIAEIYFPVSSKSVARKLMVSGAHFCFHS